MRLWDIKYSQYRTGSFIMFQTYCHINTPIILDLLLRAVYWSRWEKSGSQVIHLRGDGWWPPCSEMESSCYLFSSTLVQIIILYVWLPINAPWPWIAEELLGRAYASSCYSGSATPCPLIITWFCVQVVHLKLSVPNHTERMKESCGIVHNSSVSISYTLQLSSFHPYSFRAW